MESEFNDTQLLIRKTLREYFMREIDPLVPDMEDGKLLCYEPIRKMVRDLGLGSGGGEFAEVMADSAPEDQLPLFMMRIFPIEIARICGGLCLSWGASIGLAGGAVNSRGTPEQKTRWGGPIQRFEKIGAWCLTEPGAGSAAIRDMKTRAVADGDTNGDALVDVADLLAVLAAWGPCLACDADTNGDGQVDVADLPAGLAAWGTTV